MDQSFVPIIFVVFIFLAIVIRLAAGSFDGERVEQHIREMGGTVLDRSWDPFGPGWFGDKNSRIYQIRYEDSEGAIHEAHVKTSMLSGVYLTNDRITKSAPAKAQASSLQALPTDLAEENARLRARLRDLEGER